jgi:hypothetical protein
MDKEIISDLNEAYESVAIEFSNFRNAHQLYAKTWQVRYAKMARSSLLKLKRIIKKYRVLSLEEAK